MFRTLRVACFSAVLVLFSGVSAALAEDAPAEWLSSLDEAVELAESSHRQIMVDLWADWCTWCKRLEEDVFSTAVFADYARRFVLLRVDTEDGGEGTRLKERFQVDSLPTTLILTSDLVKVGELQGYLKAEQYIQSLDLERMMHHLLVIAYDETDADTELDTVKMMADDFHGRHDGDRAANLYRLLLGRASESDPAETAWNRYLLADSLRLSGTHSEARSAQVEARAAAVEVGDRNLVELTELLHYQIARDGQECAEATQTLETFLSDHPEGKYRKQAEKALSAIRRDRRCV